MAQFANGHGSALMQQGGTGRRNATDVCVGTVCRLQAGVHVRAFQSL